MINLTLSELNKIIRDCLDLNLDPSYWVIAEISELKTNQKGHCYLELVEKKDDDILAKARATIWSYAYRNLSMWFEASTGESLKAGLKILANVTVSYHEVYGLSLNIRDIDANYTIGERSRKRQEVINRLKEDGVFDMNRELSLPLVPQRVAVISSPTAAGYQDFTDQLEKNGHGYKFNITLFKALMQGREAESSIMNAMLSVFRHLTKYDIVVIIRGGGGAVDLECFDSYQVASHIAQFPLPVITGIGHEKDETIADLVANTKLKTPTAVAEFLITGIRKYEETILELFEYINDYSIGILDNEKSRLELISENLKHESTSRFTEISNSLNLLSNNLSYSLKNEIDNLSSRVNHAAKQIRQESLSWVILEKEIVKRMETNLALLDPRLVLKRGYSITRKNGKLVRSIENLMNQEIITTELADGTIESRVIDTKK
jgi:exodeoxyribonuclease VII large subunit